MEIQHVNVKVPVDGDFAISFEQIVETFHRWVSQQSRNELLIDVADYLHVPSGPGIVLVGHDADYSLDNANGVWGMRYNRKASVEGSNADRLTQALRTAMDACIELETEYGDGIKFSRSQFEVVFNDRALTPNTDETWSQVQPELESALKDALGSGLSVERQSNPRGRLGATVTSSSPFELLSLA